MNPKIPLAIKEAFTAPSAKQKEAYGRLSHTLCAAAVIALMSFFWTTKHPNLGDALTIFALTFSAVVAFLIGAILCKGD